MTISEEDRVRIEAAARVWVPTFLSRAEVARGELAEPSFNARAAYIAGATAEVARYALLVEAAEAVYASLTRELHVDRLLVANGQGQAFSAAAERLETVLAGLREQP